MLCFLKIDIQSNGMYHVLYFNTIHNGFLSIVISLYKFLVSRLQSDGDSGQIQNAIHQDEK